ncbi:MAG TPA: S26 family signal peptidase [Roseiarcus sp.]|nr:S26 family signal peptidase [Roseiarcus sp.]
MIGRDATLAITLLGVGVTALTQFDGHPPWLVWNASASVPIGLYAVDTIIDTHAGDLVVVRPPEPLGRFLADGGYLPRGVPLLKHVAALAGQSVCRIGVTISVDGVAVGDAHERDSRGRALPVWQGCRVIGQDEVFLMNRRSADSLDGRYFGPLPAATIVGRAIPLWIDPPEKEK